MLAQGCTAHGLPVLGNENEGRKPTARHPPVYLQRMPAAMTLSGLQAYAGRHSEEESGSWICLDEPAGGHTKGAYCSPPCT